MLKSQSWYVRASAMPAGVCFWALGLVRLFVFWRESVNGSVWERCLAVHGWVCRPSELVTFAKDRMCHGRRGGIVWMCLSYFYCATGAVSVSHFLPSFSSSFIFIVVFLLFHRNVLIFRLIFIVWFNIVWCSLNLWLTAQQQSFHYSRDDSVRPGKREKQGQRDLCSVFSVDLLFTWGLYFRER